MLMKLYHTSTVGANNETLESFKKGIKTNLAAGYGQGYGFYVFANRSAAIHHAKYLADEAADEKIGNPIIVQIEADVTPKNFDIDYEVLTWRANKFLYDNFDTIVKSIPDYVVRCDSKSDKYLIPSKSRIAIFNGAVQLALGNKSGGMMSLKSFGTNSDRDVSSYEGEVIGSIMAYVEKNFPKEFEQWESSVFQEVFSKRDSNALQAIKYVGKETLYPEKIDMLVDGGWKTVFDSKLKTESKFDRLYYSVIKEKCR